GSLVAALASWLDARAHGGRWLVRIEDVDTPRCVPGADRTILQQLQACGLVPDEPPAWQSQRNAMYQAALEQLLAAGWAYPCACSRQDIETALLQVGQLHQRHAERIYPGTCRNGLHGKPARAWRFATQAYASQRRTPYGDIDGLVLRWSDRLLGPQQQDVTAAIGDFVLLRADGLYAYQLAVVVDDAAQGISHVVRGADLADNTARQIFLQHALGLPTPLYLHTPLVCNAHGEKLSKQNGAQSLDTSSPRAAWSALCQAARVLGLSNAEAAVPNDAAATQAMRLALAQWSAQWAARYAARSSQSP
ncbi:MAG: tRNA glutamyl-Q(34) synthetase GluQRS, partial [Rhodoferax sp.]